MFRQFQNNNKILKYQKNVRRIQEYKNIKYLLKNENTFQKLRIERFFFINFKYDCNKLFTYL